ncbi:MAG: hypothetical protein DRJ60_00035 [Thermoprotei archaeon]|nr:MAG: hypothetical protein DRJ60_00035 [Thermoprotei archaeon]
MKFVHLRAQVVRKVRKEVEGIRKIAESYADLIRKVNERIWRAYSEAYEEAWKETGVREEALFRVATYFNLVLNNYGFKELAESERELDSYKVFDLINLQLEKHSEDYGSSLAVEEIGMVINPPTYRLYGGIDTIFNLNRKLREVTREAIRKCKKLLGDKRFNTCIARVLREGYENVKWWYDKLDDEELKEDLKTIYKKLSIIWSK